MYCLIKGGIKLFSELENNVSSPYLGEEGERKFYLINKLIGLESEVLTSLVLPLTT